GAGIPSLGEGIGFMGDFTYFFPDQDVVDYWELNGNLSWDIPVEDAPVAPFVLGGLNIARFSSTISDASETELGLNLGGGIRLGAAALQPIIGAKFELNGGEGFVLFASLPFNVGG
ncbi:MAG: hypothetical protein R3223_13160, partial [Longimicrobiales bacterium]|nr:hypothetical protein [Longimicrobiales bacterium]